MKISIQTLGCKLNQAESLELKNELEKTGYIIVSHRDNPDWSIIRACGVTCSASQSTRELIRQAKKRGSKVIATGCLENKNLKEIDYIAKNNEDITLYLKKHTKIKNENAKKISTKTRSMIKIQNGCNFNCAYCLIPSFRGKNIAISPEKIIKQIKEEELKNKKEVILTGVNICQYSHKELNLTKLLKKVLKETGIPRIRLGSLDPRLITSDFIKLFSDNKRLMPHWHLSLQSGSDEILKKMNRHYTAKKYLSIIEKMRKQIPFFSVTTDIIVGFPGETENNFNKSVDIIKKAQFSKVHVFPYSRRPGTPADEMPDQVQDNIKTERAKKLREVAEQTAKKFKQKFIGKSSNILFEQNKNGFYTGYTPEYIQIKIKSSKKLKNQIKNLILTEKNIV